MCYNSSVLLYRSLFNDVVMVASSSPPINLSYHLPDCHQKAFVPFRFQGQTIARVAQQAALPAVSRPIFGSDIVDRILFPINIILLSPRFNIVYLTAAIMYAFFLPPPISGFGNGGIKGGSELNVIEFIYTIQSRAFLGKRC